MIVIQELHSMQEAQVAKSFLAANGIDAIIVGEESMSAMPHISVGMKSFQLLVQEEDKETALSLFENITASETSEDIKPPSTQVTILKYVAIGAMLLYLLSFIIQRATS